MPRILREPRWIGLALLVLLAVVVCYFLSGWQWDRYEGRKAANSTLSVNMAKPVEQVTAVMPAGSAVTRDNQWRVVTATGTYDVAGQALVRLRPLDNVNGFWVATPLVMQNGQTVVINRGWVRAGADSLSTPSVPAPPTGEVTVTGRVQPSQPGKGTRPPDMPVGQISSLDTTVIAAVTGKPALPGYIDLTQSQPAQAAGLTPIPLPELDEGPHLSYSMQWVAFAIVFVIGLGLLVRREIRTRREEGEAARAGVSAAGSQDSQPSRTAP